MAKRKAEQKFPPGWTGSLVVPNETYAALYKIAKWVQAWPDALEMPERTADDLQEAYQELLKEHLPEDMSLFDVETGAGAGLVLVVSQAATEDNPNVDEAAEYRIRLRKQQ